MGVIAILRLLLHVRLMRPRSQVPESVEAAVLGPRGRQRGQAGVRLVDALLAHAPPTAVAAAQHTVEVVALAP